MRCGQEEVAIMVTKSGKEYIVGSRRILKWNKRGRSGEKAVRRRRRRCVECVGECSEEEGTHESFS